ncbi:double-strand break repair helicase AddA [Acuticoccus sp.]|uniref:double-strand break repair helicase AddA n=1 Tax=Acuticoccus sp. TaxID=1904378 RepID=UPI003B516470
MSGLVVPPEADEAQRRSSDPTASVWVSANAGAGKTYVLAQRVVRLLLSGVPPRAILCLTYTTAAAAEMAQRVTAELASLATLPDDALAARVATLAPAGGQAARTRARTLFAEALETPGGLKVQTIHAFCAALLRRFPLEANVSGSFQVLDDATREELTERAISAVLGRAAAEPTGAIAERIACLVPHVSDAGVSKSLKAVLAEHRRLGAWLRRGTSDEFLAQGLRAALAPPEPGPPLGKDVCHRLHEALVAAGKGEATRARIKAALGCPEAERPARWAEVFRTKAGERRALAGIVPKSVLAQWPEVEATIDAEQDRLDALAEVARVEAAIAATVPLVQLAFAVEEELSAETRRRGLLDYDDQVETAVNLVRTGTAAAWVRHKLDEGIDHVMVDEAQDTSEPQWRLVEALTEEFFAGAGAREVPRTLFVVGDEKQSIYSFQGAAPHLFALKRAATRSAAEAAQLAFHAVGLEHSMRSAPQVLSAVDRVFADPELAAAVGAEAATIRHQAVKAAPGGVDLWPLFADDEVERPLAWDAPFDATPDSAGVVKLVRAIADQVALWTGAEGPDGGPRVAPGEVMILSRRRGAFATLMNRELKARGIPVAGVDRLVITEHIAVKDMVALMRALLSRDDLSLAAVLRGPLFGFSEEALYAAAHGRPGSLLDALARGDAEAREAHRTLSRWARIVRAARPFDALAHVLVGEGRRADFVARMGAEAADALDALLDAALSFEGRGVPALETFLYRLSKTTEELKRTVDGSSDAVRVMTAHGAKGLEAKLVFVADVGARTVRQEKPPIVALPTQEPHDVLVHAPRDTHRPARAAAALDDRRTADRAEHYRLLYVAMTRAEQHLVVCGAYGKTPPQEGMWHAKVEAALAGEAMRVAMPGGEGFAWRSPELGTAAHARYEPRARPVPPVAPRWLTEPVAPPRSLPEPLSPSDGEHRVSAGSAAGTPRALGAAAHGVLIHHLLDRGGDREAMAASVRSLHPLLTELEIAAVVAEAASALALPELAGGRARTEVDVVGDIVWRGERRRARGRIDRLQFIGQRALVVDYKTDRVVPDRPADVAQAYVEQLSIYRALVAAALPRHAVSAAIVWTASASCMAMDDVLVPVPSVVTA